MGERCPDLDGEKQFEVPELTMELMERLAGYTLVGFHVKSYPVTDELLAPFAGHKSMANFGVEDGALTDACLPFFRAQAAPSAADREHRDRRQRLSALKAVSWTCWPLTTLGWMMPVCSRRLPSPSSPTSRSTIPL